MKTGLLFDNATIVNGDSEIALDSKDNESAVHIWTHLLLIYNMQDIMHTGKHRMMQT